MSLNRRDFLESSTALILGAAWGSASPRRPTRRGPKRVLVIGAGPAGITAAHELRRAGVDVTVFEARSRAGGRMHTLRSPFADGLYAEAGALFLTDTNPGLEYARELGLSAVEVPLRQQLGSVAHVAGERIVLRPGEPPVWPLDLREDEQGKTIRELQGRYHYGGLPPLEELELMRQADFPQERFLALDELSLADFWRRNGASEAAIHLMSLRYFGSYGDGPGDVSALQLARERASYLGTTAAVRIEGGNDLIVRTMAARLGSSVHYGSPVVAMSRDDEGVTVTAQNRSGQEEFSGDYLVCTVPLQVLGSIAATPPLSDLRVRAAREVKGAETTRVYMQCRERFWESQGLDGSANTDLPIGGVLHSTMGLPGPRGILEAFAVGAGARALGAASPQERLDRAVEAVADVLPGLREFVEGGTSYSWGDDPWARGAFSVFAPGQVSEFHAGLCEPEGRFHFAGDALGGAPGYSHAAFRSGRRAAADVLARG